MSVNLYTMSMTPTPTLKAEQDLPAQRDPIQKSRYAYAANSLLSTIRLTKENIKDWAILNSGATSHFLIVEAPTSQTEVASEPLIVRLPDGARVKLTHTCKLALLCLNRTHCARTRISLADISSDPMQRGLHGGIHKDRMYGTIPRKNYPLWTQVSQLWSMDG